MRCGRDFYFYSFILNKKRNVQFQKKNKIKTEEKGHFFKKKKKKEKKERNCFWEISITQQMFNKQN